MFKHVLLASDGSEPAAKAVERGLALAKLVGADATAVTVSEPNTVPTGRASQVAQRIEVLRLSQEIGRQTKAAIDERQREVLLREQLATIRRQLGEGEDGKAEIAELSDAIGKASMPKEVDEQARKELRRLERMPEASAEHGMVRSYLDWSSSCHGAYRQRSRSTSLQHGAFSTKTTLDSKKSNGESSSTLQVRKLAPHGKAPILCLVGPPGVGKTSLGQSIARAMQRKFVRESLGGVHDEAEIRGHRRTYIGALPGNIIQAIRKAGARNCVMMLDEIRQDRNRGAWRSTRRVARGPGSGAEQQL